MSERITWTHVDRYVRDAHDKRGMLPFGQGDAEVTLNYVQLLERELGNKQSALELAAERCDRAEEKLRFRHETPLKKSKQRIADLEENVEIIRRHLGLEL